MLGTSWWMYASQGPVVPSARISGTGLKGVPFLDPVGVFGAVAIGGRQVEHRRHGEQLLEVVVVVQGGDLRVALAQPGDCVDVHHPAGQSDRAAYLRLGADSLVDPGMCRIDVVRALRNGIGLDEAERALAGDGHLD